MKGSGRLLPELLTGINLKVGLVNTADTWGYRSQCKGSSQESNEEQRCFTRTGWYPSLHLYVQSGRGEVVVLGTVISVIVWTIITQIFKMTGFSSRAESLGAEESFLFIEFLLCVKYCVRCYTYLSY